MGKVKNTGSKVVTANVTVTLKPSAGWSLSEYSSSITLQPGEISEFKLPLGYQKPVIDELTVKPEDNHLIF